MDLADHPFSRENIARESTAYIDRSEAAWLRWCNMAERILGHDLDGDDNAREGEGFSIDEAFASFSAGFTPQNYAAIVRARKRYDAFLEQRTVAAYVAEGLGES